MNTKQGLVSMWKANNIITSERVIAAFLSVAREEFVTPELRSFAYDDNPLPIMRERTISQPTTVAIMTQALEPLSVHKVFEVGTGSGYQAAILSKLAKKVISAEVVPELVSFARENLKRAGIDNVEVIEEDGGRGYEKEAPFARIILTAACAEIPQPLVDQLSEGGILVAPVGDKNEQELARFTKINGILRREVLGSFRFLPLTGKFGFEEEI